MLKAQGSCEFRKEVKSVYSLSGPVTKILEEIQLLPSSTIKGISVFYPAKIEKRKIPGGIFIAPGLLNEMKDSVIFYDESQELRKLFSSQNIHALSLVSRGKNPREVMEEAEKLISPYLLDCGDKLSQLKAKITELENKIRKKNSVRQNIVFFLGEVKPGKLPDLVIANDGIAKWLKVNKKISGYPSDLAYVNWSAQVLEALPKETLLLGLKEALTPEIQGQFPRLTLFYPGVLMPGMTQLEAWDYFLDHVPRDRL